MTIRHHFFFCAITLLTACGGGGSSSGAGNVAPVAPVVPVVPVTYTGTQILILTAAGISARDEVAFVLVLNGRTVTIQDADFSASTTLSSDFGPYEVTSPSLSIEIDATTTCIGTVTYTGAISPTLTNGNVSGSFDCSGLILVLTGTYSATPGNAKAGLAGLGSALRSALINRN